jgi:hypothetical protein
MSDMRQKLIGLLDYIEQVVRLDEPVAFRLSEYHLLDGSTFAITKADTHNLPGRAHKPPGSPGWPPSSARTLFVGSLFQIR